MRLLHQLLQKHTKDKLEWYSPDHVDYWKLLPRAYAQEKSNVDDLF